ncbi:hypothetical protein K435DRAFT_870299 [Dendrothele bispora CBS 962.96]|uniref:Heterokaryon incompatibility domain-containing protein n=1 Tax=Dendrothele bispora (strain CBS 962.96) TaxID=1314807 RepID=A0A4S8L7N0_DENBC|nr:hypothetical protein K435DRAFT_870299 [Dendrothele bispora CBS 962.96]
MDLEMRSTHAWSSLFGDCGILSLQDSPRALNFAALYKAAINPKNMSPTRLFKIDAIAIEKDSSQVDGPTEYDYGTLVEGEDTQDKPYCAVSHVWGDPAKIQQFKIKDVPWEVPIESIDKLLFILRACAKQKYEYIWLDILCIRQSKDRNDREANKDKKREMAKMNRYYLGDAIVFGSQYATFADHWDQVHRIVDVWEEDKTVDKKIDTLKKVWEGLDDIKTLLEDQWFSRIWTLQEAVLPRRLYTSNGATMDFGFCRLIDWTYTALGNETLNGNLCEEVEYSWIHPGEGVVNDQGWREVSQGFLCAINNDRARRAELHPLEALVITKFRKSRYEIDKLRGVYGMIDKRWHVFEETDFKRAWEATTVKYITDRPAGELPDLAPLVTMSVTKDLETPLTWGAGESERMASVVPQRKWTNKSGNTKLVLHLTASGICKISSYGTAAYGDGSGELGELIWNLSQVGGDISAILSLLTRAVHHSEVRMTSNGIDGLQEVTQDIGDANAVSSGLREIFTGWDRWIVSCTNGPLQGRAFLAWFPRKDEEEKSLTTKARLDRCSLLWSCPGHNEWAVIVELVDGQTSVYRKVGIAFVDSEHPGPEVDVIVV